MITNKELLAIYIQGFADELKGEAARQFNHELSQRAYDFGRLDAIAGDDVSSLDHQTDKEILKKIKRKRVFVVQGENLLLFGCFDSRKKAETYINGSLTMKIRELDVL